jgi:hypothetical protein
MVFIVVVYGFLASRPPRSIPIARQWHRTPARWNRNAPPASSVFIAWVPPADLPGPLRLLQRALVPAECGALQLAMLAGWNQNLGRRLAVRLDHDHDHDR